MRARPDTLAYRSAKLWRRDPLAQLQALGGGDELNLAGLRSRPLTPHPYLVFYVERPDDIDVWRVLHGQRDIPGWTQAPDDD